MILRTDPTDGFPQGGRAPIEMTMLGPCPSPAPISVIHIHGTADQTIPYTGGMGKRDNGGAGAAGPVRIDGPPVPTLISTWRGIDRWARPAGSEPGDRAGAAARSTIHGTGRHGNHLALLQRASQADRDSEQQMRSPGAQSAAQLPLHRGLPTGRNERVTMAAWHRPTVSTRPPRGWDAAGRGPSRPGRRPRRSGCWYEQTWPI